MHYQDLSDKTFFNLIFTKEDRLGLAYVEEAKKRRDAIVPFLCEVLQKEENYHDETERGWGVIHAVYLLGILADERALDALLTASRHTDTYDIDWLYEAFGECYARIGPAAIPALKARILEDRDEDDKAPLFEMDGLWNIWEAYPETRQDIEDFYLALLQKQGGHYEIKSHLMADFAGLKRHDLRPLFEKLMEEGQYDPFTFSQQDLDSFYNDLVDHKPGFRKDLEAFYREEEIAARQERWEKEDADYEEKMLKEDIIKNIAHIGRNDPCPCGSGKKYKKCHMAAVEEEMGRRRTEASNEDKFIETSRAVWEERECEAELRRMLAGKGKTALFPELKAAAIEVITAPMETLAANGFHSYFEPMFDKIGFSNKQDADAFIESFFTYYNALAFQYKGHPRDKRKVH